jgi:hypothetical protein
MAMSDGYWVYENWQAGTHKAVVHAGSCSFCNDGRGLSLSGTDPKHGQWHGPFPSGGVAEACARRTGGVLKFCHFCTCIPKP